MDRPPNPISSGFRAVLRDPVIFLLEILWRWSFAIVALFLIFATGLILSGSVPEADSFAAAWRAQDFQLLGFVAANTVILLWKKLIIAAVIVPFLIAILWSILAALGRGLTIRRLRPAIAPLGFRSMLGLQLWRGLLAWFCMMALLIAVGGEAYLAIRRSKPDLFLFYQLALPSVLLITIFWLVTNWFLTMASIFGQSSQSSYRAFRQGRQIVRRQRADFAGTGFIFLLFRIVLLLIAISICGLTSSMMASSPQTYAVLVAVVALVYFAVSDFLYISRMASYLALASAYIEPAGAKPNSPVPITTGRKISTL